MQLRTTLIVLSASAVLGGLFLATENVSSEATAASLPSAEHFSFPIYSFVQPEVDDLELALYRAGLQPERLAAAGADAEDVQNVVSDVNSALLQNPGMLRAADESCATLARRYHELEELVRQMQADQEEEAEYAQVAIDLQDAEANRLQLLDALFEAGAADLAPGQVSILSELRANAQWKLPLPYLVLDRDEPQWVQLREALANERISAQWNESADQELQALLNQARSDTAFTTANTNLNTYLSTVQQAWNAAVESPGGEE